MSNYVVKRRKAYFFQMVKRHIKENLICYLSLLVLFLIGLIIGVFTVCGVSTVEIDILMDTVLLRLFNDEISFLVFFLLRCIYSIFLIMLILLFTLKNWMIPLVGILTLYKGYTIGFNITVIFLCLGFSGVVCGIIIFIPCWLISMLVYLNCSCVFIRRCILFKKYGKLCFDNGFTTQKLLLIYCIALIIISIIEALLVSMVVMRFIIE